MRQGHDDQHGHVTWKKSFHKRAQSRCKHPFHTSKTASVLPLDANGQGPKINEILCLKPSNIYPDLARWPPLLSPAAIRGPAANTVQP